MFVNPPFSSLLSHQEKEILSDLATFDILETTTVYNAYIWFYLYKKEIGGNIHSFSAKIPKEYLNWGVVHFSNSRFYYLDPEPNHIPKILNQLNPSLIVDLNLSPEKQFEAISKYDYNEEICKAQYDIKKERKTYFQKYPELLDFLPSNLF